MKILFKQQQQNRSYYALPAIVFVFAFNLCLASLYFQPQNAQAEDSRYFPETKHTVSGKVLDYWQNNGGLSVYGYPITDAQNEVDPETGKTFLTQWFERNRFELHPEFAGTRYEVLLGLLGKDLRREGLTVDPDFKPVASQPDTVTQRYFKDTSHIVRGSFLTYWESNGGLERFGFPIDEEHVEVDPETGNPYSVQWFERARFEHHPENAGTPYEVLLGLLGNQIKYPKTKLEFAWKLDSRANPALGQPQLLAFDSENNLYVADNKDLSIKKYSTTGQFISKWGESGTGPGQFQDIGGLAIDGKGNIYISEANTSRIQKFDSQGKFLLSWNLDTPAYGIASDKNGTIYVYGSAGGNGSYQPSYISKYDPNGNLLKEWTNSELTDPSITFNISGLAVNGTGQIALAVRSGVSPSLRKYDASGKLLANWDISNDVQNQVFITGNPAFDSQGNLYLADYHYEANTTGIGTGKFIEGRLRRYDPSGNVITLFTWHDSSAAEGQLNFTSFIGVDAQNSVFVADMQRIQKFKQG